MCTSLVFLTLIWFRAPSATVPEPSWHTQYSVARQQGREEEKPIAVFVGSGKAGWNQVSREGDLGSEAKRLLADNYVCLYVDTDREEGRQLAGDLDLGDGPGLVISSATGRLQAFRHEGDLEEEDLVYYLRRYADPDLIVRTTETTRRPRLSYYSTPVQYIAQPAMGMGFFPGFGGGAGGC
jgi:hypothetical protein